MIFDIFVTFVKESPERTAAATHEITLLALWFLYGVSNGRARKKRKKERCMRVYTSEYDATSIINPATQVI